MSHIRSQTHMAGPCITSCFRLQLSVTILFLFNFRNMSASTGTVKWFNESKGYGFISQDSGPDVFAHFRAIVGAGYKTLAEGQRVRFEVVQGTKGLQAENIEVID